MSEISIKGLDELGQRWLTQKDPDGNTTHIATRPGSTASADALERYKKQRLEEFIKRAATMTEDILGFITDERIKRGLTDEEVIFALALANINLRQAYGSPQNETEHKEGISKERSEALLEEFDSICYQAQQYYDSNT